MTARPALPSLLDGQQWGYASRSRHRAMAGPVACHIIVGAPSADEGQYGYLLCSGGWGITGNGGGDPCRACLHRLQQEKDELDND